jgi:23S rRNA maturation-related 3'-5' exoribonuclease YhaM
VPSASLDQFAVQEDVSMATASEPTKEELRAGVLKSLPEIAEIKDNTLREKVLDLWVLSLSNSEFRSIDEMECSGMVGMEQYPGRTQSDHLRGVGRIARAIAQQMVDMCGDDVHIDPDISLASGLVHDAGKPYFYSPRNYKRFHERKPYVGRPAFRHTMYGAHLAIEAGMPEEIVHCIASHDLHLDGQYVVPSAYAKILASADQIYWDVLMAFDLLEKSSIKVTGPLPLG